MSDDPAVGSLQSNSNYLILGAVTTGLGARIKLNIGVADRLGKSAVR